MEVKFKLPYVGARKIADLHAYRKQDDRYFIYYGKRFTEVDSVFVDSDGVVWIKDNDGFLVMKEVEMRMTLEEVYENLCVKDQRSPYYVVYDEDEKVISRENCCCDNCFYGRDKLALVILEFMEKDL